MKKYEKIQKALAEPFNLDELEFRLQSCGETNGRLWGRYLTYVQSRAIMNRLDEVVGIENWKVDYTAGPDGGVVCHLSIKFDDEWITKVDGAENTDIESVKGGISSALKRAGNCFGIGRYLYKLTENYADISDKGKYKGKTKDKKYFKWSPKPLPVWALPKSKPARTEVSTSNVNTFPEPKQEQSSKQKVTPAKVAKHILNLVGVHLPKDQREEMVNNALKSWGLPKYNELTEEQMIIALSKEEL